MQRVTVNLTPRGADALESACRRGRQNRTDTINSALSVLVIVLDIQARSDGWLNTIRTDGGIERVYVV